VVEWNVQVISRVHFLLTWEISTPELEKRLAEWKGFFRAAVNLTMPEEDLIEVPCIPRLRPPAMARSHSARLAKI
jgi:hypothetical protein